MSNLVEHPNELTFTNGVPFVIWCYWEGPSMTGNRLLSFEYLLKNIQVPVCLVTTKILQNFIKPHHPLPILFDKLSIVHRSDYIRAYLLHHYGGAWHDIKATEVSYAHVWKEFEDNNIWIVGRRETYKGAAKVIDNQDRYMPDFYEKLIAVPSWVGRAQSPLSTEILQGIENMLTKHSLDLIKYPAQHPREKKLVAKNSIDRLVKVVKFKYQKRSLNYPLEWTVFGNIFHPTLLKYQQHISYNLPIDREKNAGIYHRG